jgi:acyl-CoA dehydrogenase
MFDFEPTQAQRRLIDAARDFAHHRVMPIAASSDESSSFPVDLLGEAHALGLLNVTIPSDCGGPELGHLESGLVTEQLAYACSGIQASLTANVLATTALLLAGSASQKRKYLGWIAREPVMAAFAASEAEAGSDLAAMKCRAVPDGAGGYALSGTKQWVTNANLASYFIVFATDAPESRHRGIGAFIVERSQCGVTPGRPVRKLGQRASDTAPLELQDVRVSADAVLAPPGHGFKLAMDTFTRTRPEIAAASAGLMQRCLDEAMAYSKGRTSFGVPIAKHQLVASMLADMAIRVEATSLLARKAAWAIDQGRPDPVISSSAKAFGADCAMQTAIDAVQIFGGNGYTTDYPVEKLMRDAKILQIYEGTSEVQRLVIARQMLEL